MDNRSTMEKLDPNFTVKDPDEEIIWHPADKLTIEGQGWPDSSVPYTRLPDKARANVRDAVWELSRHSAGVTVRFQSDSPIIAANWQTEYKVMPHMACSGRAGVDLYLEEENGAVIYANTGKPRSAHERTEMIAHQNSTVQNYRLYLPLYSQLFELSVGIRPGHAIAAASPITTKPLLFYGTSITQGGCASRPGMAYPSILGRMLCRPIINLGFSGNGKTESEVVDLLCELDPAVFVIDPLANMAAQGVRERVPQAVRRLRSAHPQTPIVLLPQAIFHSERLKPVRTDAARQKNRALQAGYEACLKEKIPLLYFIPHQYITGRDGEGTVDGGHPTDLGFMRMAEYLAPRFETILQSGHPEKTVPKKPVPCDTSH